jgi:hypothetical protein
MSLSALATSPLAKASSSDVGLNLRSWIVVKRFFIDFFGVGRV